MEALHSLGLAQDGEVGSPGVPDEFGQGDRDRDHHSGHRPEDGHAEGEHLPAAKGVQETHRGERGASRHLLPCRHGSPRHFGRWSRKGGRHVGRWQR